MGSGQWWCGGHDGVVVVIGLFGCCERDKVRDKNEREGSDRNFFILFYCIIYIILMCYIVK